jgi:hypothetical protein
MKSESVEISEQSDGFLKSQAAYHEGQAKKAGKSGPTKLEGLHNMAAHHFKQALNAPSMDKRDYHHYKATSYADDAMEHQKSLQKEDTVNELKSSTLKSYLKTNLKKTVEKDGQTNPPLFKLKARAKGMETAISKLMKKEAVIDEAKSAHFVHNHDSEDVLSAHNMIHKRAEDIAKKNNGKVIRVSNVKTNIEYPGGHSTTITTKKEDDRVKSDINHIYEAMVYDPLSKKMVARKPIKVQAGGGATRNGVPVETGLSKYKQGLPMLKVAGVLAAEEKKPTSFKSIREAACQTPVYTSYYKGRKLHFCGSKGKSASSRSGGSFSSGNISGEGGAGSGNGGGDGGGGNGGGGGM